MSPFRGSVPLTQEWRHFRFGAADGIATVTLDRPDKLNALTFDSYADLRDLLAELPRRGDVRVLVLRGSGRAFCSGGDVCTRSSAPRSPWARTNCWRSPG